MMSAKNLRLCLLQYRGLPKWRCDLIGFVTTSCLLVSLVLAHAAYGAEASARVEKHDVSTNRQDSQLPSACLGEGHLPAGVGVALADGSERTSAAEGSPDTAPQVSPTSYEPTENYEVREMRGWRVFVHKSLLNEDEALGRDALELLDFQLYQITRVVPEPALEKLRQIPIWLENNNPRVACACYHPSRRWLRANGFNPDKAGSVEIGNARRFLRWTREQPWMVLHELAHGYHHRFLGGYDQPEIAEAWREARDAGLYDSVLHIRGHREPAYARNNPQEYFAELSEAWFGVNDFYPFVRAEVKVHDPKGAALLEKLWGTGRRTPPFVNESGEGDLE